MTTNQTIDGVPRKSLEQALKLAAVFDDGGDGAGAESARGVVWILRALLDAPACKRCNGSGWIDNLRQVGTQAMDCPDCKSATQLTNAQRRAADYKEQQAFNDWAWNKEGEAIGRMDGQAAAIEAWHARAKLAEQPAPVAVRLPERKDPGEYRDGSYTQTCMSGEWNACLDELKRLNPSL
ncbi:MAG: hypothetical protein JJK56_21225 [Pseudomonas sp.]|uniref:hypothetical protein n=1 Tax=Pseudomonas sp. TaxID=306 RepID=UPI001A504A74|nr:hypothetical protein [Pseudomonas sp.]MBL7230484.1 hypothetical protein [Pseudomonas sp.]